MKNAQPPDATRRGTGERTNEEIYEKIFTSIFEHRLPPGTKLAEERLGAVFKVSRARIREVLSRLSHEQIVEIVPHRGAHVAKPTLEQARQVFEARRVIEPSVVAALATARDQNRVDLLRKHVLLETDARAANDDRAVIRLSGEFHIVASELAGNAFLARPMRELATLTCLTILLYGGATPDSCRLGEHDAIVGQIADGNADGARRAVIDHLDAIEAGIDPHRETPEVDLETILG
ncbi:GntR family transcriptional regulator [Pseudonocardia ailaonensis]|uniref:GntR family transcriptional regulator n=1 Tax=Pseudonocardia ailaonensis TaxID=367279 RepID=A0ABN2MQK3_9PSEU